MYGYKSRTRRNNEKEEVVVNNNQHGEGHRGGLLVCVPPSEQPT